VKPQPPPSLLLGLEPVQSCLGVARVMSLSYISAEIVKQYLHSTGFHWQCSTAQIFFPSAELRRKMELIFNVVYLIETT